MAVVNKIEALEQYFPELLDKALAKESLTEVLIGKSELNIDWLDAKTIKVPKLATTGLTTYQRGGHNVSNTRGAVDQTWEQFTLTQERYSEIPLDTLDNSDGGAKVLGHLGKEFVRTKVIQELDAYRFSKLASYTDKLLGNRLEGESIDKTNVITKLNDAIAWFDNNKVPANERVIYVSNDVMKAIRNSSEIYKTLQQADYKAVDFTIYEYNGCKIVAVPDDEFYTDLITDGTGYHPTSTSKKINFLAVWTGAPFVAKRFDYSKIFNSVDGGAYLGFVGYLATNLIYHDIFVPDNKIVGIYASISSTSATGVGSGLLVGFKAGTSNKTVITRVLTQPQGIIYDKLYNYTTNGTAPAIGTSVSALTEVKVGVEFQPNASHNIIVAGLNGLCVAVSKDFTSTLPVGE